LNDNGPVSDTPADANVFNSQRNEIASAQLAIDRKVEKGQFTLLVGNLETNRATTSAPQMCQFTAAARPVCKV
jgi:hypothetical protein